MEINRLRHQSASKSSHMQCRTLDLGLEGFAECLQVGPNPCKFALPFGYGFLCSAPDQTSTTRQAKEAASHELRD